MVSRGTALPPVTVLLVPKRELKCTATNHPKHPRATLHLHLLTDYAGTRLPRWTELPYLAKRTETGLPKRPAKTW